MTQPEFNCIVVNPEVCPCSEPRSKLSLDYSSIKINSKMNTYNEEIKEMVCIS